MENITADIIINTFFWHQFLNFFINLIMPFFILSILVAITLIIAYIVYKGGNIACGYIERDKEQEIATETMLKTWAIRTSIIAAVFLVIFAGLRFGYQVIFKTHVLTIIAPAGLDLMEGLSKEVAEMWNILKGVLNK